MLNQTNKQINKKKNICKSNKSIEMCKKIYIYKPEDKYIEMHVEKYLFEIINGYMKSRNYKNM